MNDNNKNIFDLKKINKDITELVSSLSDFFNGESEILHKSKVTLRCFEDIEIEYKRYMKFSSSPAEIINLNIGILSSNINDLLRKVFEFIDTVYRYNLSDGDSSARIRITDNIEKIKSKASLIEKMINNNPNNINFDFKNQDTLIKKYESLIEKQSRDNDEFSNEINEFRTEIDKLKSYASERIDSVDKFFQDSTLKLQGDKDNIDNLLGKVSESVIAGNFDKSAENEKKSADWLRIASLGCMVLIACVVGYSLYETTTDAFKWETSLFRLIFSVLLSVPAAYLARESAKHRQQQYSHLETSLNLKAIGPYIASLPENEQNLIKSDIAKKMFTPKIQAIQNTDYYPINTQELFLKLFDKMDFKPQKDSKADTDKDKDKDKDK
ncbi:hypothetical protein WNY51_15015 [Pseudocolwellia sp. AS88]|uniref:hypothetical protein n=1 Tax=Pseudocolwellia sp. AS88 TaxID=3063958 RepID=UPI0026F2B2E1|nr:hypothetical protein [Pseudocolwellia sp. AS88]MDO7083583.1 hypothetical protein [Pseudocolwellia sp. AS88]